jgi:phosphatidylinositol dimannoside acyltransferase
VKLSRLRDAVPDLRHDSEFWRRAVRFGASRGPTPFVRYSPPLFGVASAALLPAARRALLAELRRVGADPGPLGAYGVFASYASALTEAFSAASGRTDKLEGEIVGDDHYRAARDEGKGVIVATAHTSGWYAAGPLLGSVYDDEVLVVMRKERDPRAERVQAEARARLGLRVLALGDDPLAAVPLLSHLRRGGVVALQVDRVPEGQRALEATARLGVEEIPLALPEGPLALAGLAGAPIVVVLGKREGFLRYRVQVSEPVRLPRRPSGVELRTAADKIATTLVRFIRENPRDWFHFSAPRS